MNFTIEEGIFDSDMFNFLTTEEFFARNPARYAGMLKLPLGTYRRWDNGKLDIRVYHKNHMRYMINLLSHEVIHWLLDRVSFNPHNWNSIIASDKYDNIAREVENRIRG